jgi:hypothetical protein
MPPPSRQARTIRHFLLRGLQIRGICDGSKEAQRASFNQAPGPGADFVRCSTSAWSLGTLASTLQPLLVYQLAGDRYLLVFGEEASGLAGKGDIYATDDVYRLVRWRATVDEDAKQGRQSSVSHWAYYSVLKDRLIVNIDALVAELRSAMARTKDDLDFSYRSLDLVSAYVEGIGLKRAQQEIYDHLVAYVGEVLRLRIHGDWEVNRHHRHPHPYLVGAMHDPTMPINVARGELSGLAPVNLRTAAANAQKTGRTLRRRVRQQILARCT